MENKLDSSAFFKLSYGIFVLAARDEEKDNACIINTVQLLTETPRRITVSVNRQNYTDEIIKKTGIFTVSVLTESTPFEFIKRFGFTSGRDIDKFSDYSCVERGSNGIFYVTEHTNCYIGARVVDTLEYETHTLYVAEADEAKLISDELSATYAYYHANIKPQPALQKKKGYVCKVCGYVYEGDVLPENFICPLCKHGAEDFELIK